MNRRPSRYLLFSILLFWILCVVSVSAKSRKKRNLIFNYPNPKVQVVIGIGIPVELQHEAVTMGWVIKGNYVTPYNASMYTRPSEGFSRRSLPRPDLPALPSRWQLYDSLQQVLELSAEGPSRGCLLRAVCDAAVFSLRDEGLLGEFLHVLLSPSSTQDPVVHHHDYEFYAAEQAGRRTRDIATCQRLFHECGTSPLDVFTTISEHMSGLPAGYPTPP